MGDDGLDAWDTVNEVLGVSNAMACLSEDACVRPHGGSLFATGAEGTAANAV